MDESKAWVDAVDTCGQESATLASFDNDDQYTMFASIFNFIQPNALYWIGYYHVRGTPFDQYLRVGNLQNTYENWAPSNPKSLPGAQDICAEIISSSNWPWLSEDCELSRPFFCMTGILYS